MKIFFLAKAKLEKHYKRNVFTKRRIIPKAVQLINICCKEILFSDIITFIMDIPRRSTHM